MQLGGIDSQYTDSIVWMQQATQSPSYHNFFLNDLTFCGTQILGNYSTNWNVLVDTGSVCLTLPGDIYDTFANWFTGNETVIEDVNALPAFSFTVGQGSDAATIYVPLADLLIEMDAIMNETGAPYVFVRDAEGDVQSMRLCVLRGQDITYSSAGETSYYSDAPDIVLGALALQSMYFAADYTQYTVGLANKLSDSYIDGFSAGKWQGCAAVRNCTGDQSYVRSTNTCKNPQCSRYFFTVLNTDTMKCEPNRSNMIGGLIFIILIALAETVSYFVSQYSAHAVLSAGRTATIDPVTKFVGAKLSVLVDLVVVYLLGWAPRPNLVRPMAGAPPGHGGTAGR
jgi:hypothetical protein